MLICDVTAFYRRGDRFQVSLLERGAIQAPRGPLCPVPGRKHPYHLDVSMPDLAIVIANGAYQNSYGKIAHGLVRQSRRFKVAAVIDPDCAGHDAGELLDGVPCGIPVVASLEDALECCPQRPRYCIIGVATSGGRMTADIRALALQAVNRGLSVVNGLHDWLADDRQMAAAARQEGVDLMDLRRPKPNRDLHFWTGAIRQVKAVRIAVLGTDCALGKRTTAQMLVNSLNSAGIKAELIYTGQTGWMQGGRYGFILDAVPNDFVSGELEHAILCCEQDLHPDVMVLEGQSSLRNPSGPCGAELLLSGGACGVILQHAPERECFDGFDEQGYRIPPLDEELQLIALYGAKTLGIALQGAALSDAEQHRREEYRNMFQIPVVYPLVEGVGELEVAIRQFIKNRRGSGTVN